jgi:calcium-dependent protein kinase
MGCVCSAKSTEICINMRRTNNVTKSWTISSSKFVRELDKHPDSLYTKISNLGTGSYGIVYLVRQNQTDLLFAMKEIKKNSLNYIDDLNEISILKYLDHVNILKIYEFFNDDNYIYIISEHCRGGELYTKLRIANRFKEKLVRNIMRQILSAVYYCHSKNIIHRDLKPQNILIEDEEEFVIKIIDFGTSEIFNKNKTKACIGTILYMAPEVIKHSDYNKKYDLWSCGVIMYYLLFGELPFQGTTEEEIFDKIKNSPITFHDEIWDEVSDNAKDLIIGLLERNINKRLSAEEALEHSFFQGEKERNIPKRSLLKICNNVFAYNADKVIHKAVLALILQAINQDKEIKELRSYFKIIDKNLDGRISINDLVDQFSRLIGEEDAIEVVQRLFILLDKNDYIEFEEFLLASLDKDLLLSEKNLTTVFKLIDYNQDGKICNFDLKSILKDTNNQEINRIISEHDQNKDGILDFSEFKEMMMKLK